MFFRTNTYSGSGGILFIQTKSTNLQFKSLMFFDCLASGSGGAVYFDCGGSGSSIFENICAFKCYSTDTTKSYNFPLLRTTNSHNSLLYTSISSCSPFSGRALQSTRLWNGNQRLLNCNISYNLCSNQPSVYFYSPNTLEVQWCTIANNVATGDYCLQLYSPSGTMRNSNIISNSVKTGGGIFRATGGGSLIISLSVFQGNNNILFTQISTQITVSSCVIQHSSTLTSGTAISTSSISIGLTPTIFLTHFSTFHCRVQMPSQTPAKTMSPTISRSPIPTISRSIILTSYFQKHSLISFQSYFELLSIKIILD